MKKKILFGIVGFLVLFIVAWYQLAHTVIKKYPMTIELKTIEQMQKGRILVEEKMGEILVTVVDRSGDAHIFLLKHEGVSKNEALEILNKKKLELNKEKT